MSERIPHFPFYPADFMHGVRGLTPVEVGVYMMLLCRIYEEDGPVEWHVVRLATYCGMREKTFEKTVERLLVLGKLTIESGMLSNARAMTEISSRASKLKNNSKAGKASAEKRQQNQQNDATDVEQTFNHTDTDTDTDTDSSSRSSNARTPECDDPPPTEITITAEADDLYDQVVHAVGLTGGRLPTYWMPPGAIIHVNRWLALGLTHDEIVAAARASRSNHQDPPSGPRALDRVMTSLASAKQMPALNVPQPTGASHARQAASIADRQERERRIMQAAVRGSTD